MHRLDLDLKPKLKNIIITSMKGVAGSAPGVGSHLHMAGERKALLFRGKGLEFEKYREFTVDDDAQMIDWKASLRAHKMLVKQYAEEQNKDIWFCVDVSSSMSYSSHGKLKNEYAAELIASLVFSTVETSDNAGLMMFSDHVQRVVPTNSGVGQYHKIVNELKNPKNYEGKFNLVKVMYEMSSIIGRPAIVIFVSDFIGLTGEWKRALEIMAERFELLGIMVRDPLDDKIPPVKAQIVTADPFTEGEELIDPYRIAEKYEEINRERVREIQTMFRKLRSDLLILHTTDDFVKPVRRFFTGH
ncbi:MAG: DUF58 domain-containing protein [archaeon]